MRGQASAMTKNFMSLHALRQTAYIWNPPFSHSSRKKWKHEGRRPSIPSRVHSASAMHVICLGVLTSVGPHSTLAFPKRLILCNYCATMEERTWEAQGERFHSKDQIFREMTDSRQNLETREIWFVDQTARQSI